MSLILYYHPLASFCHKILIALYENATPFTARHVDLGDPASSAELQAHWPVGKIPVLRDEARQKTIPESTIILEYLAAHHRGPVPLLPGDSDAALQARLWDRFFDLYVQVPMQKIVVDRLRPNDARDAHGVRDAMDTLGTAYAMVDRQLAKGPWAIGEAFSMADCAAAPALFYAHTLRQFEPSQVHLHAYFERLMARPSVVRVMDEARPYFPSYPYYEAIPERFKAPAAKAP